MQRGGIIGPKSTDAKQYLTPASWSEMRHDVVRMALLLIGPVLLVFVVGFAIRYSATGPFASIGSTFGMLLMAILLVWPLVLFWRKRFSRTLKTTGPIRAALMAITITTLILPSSIIASHFGLGSIGMTLNMLGPLGLTMFIGGLAMRTGDSMHCAACDYQVPPGIDTPSTKCPECGAAWREALVRGRRVRSPFLIRTGAVLVALWLLPLLTVVTGVNVVIYRLLPTPILLEIVHLSASNPVSDLHTQINELTGRTLSTEQEVRLAERFLFLRQLDGSVHFAAGGWLDAGATLPNRLPRDIIERLYMEGFIPRVDLPGTAEANEPFTLHIRGTNRLTHQSVFAFARIESIEVDGEPIAMNGPSAWVFGLYLDPTTAAVTDRSLPADQALTAEVVCPTPGRVTVRTVVRLAFTTAGNMPPPDPGSKDAPTPPVRWTDTVTIEQEVQITE